MIKFHKNVIFFEHGYVKSSKKLVAHIFRELRRRVEPVFLLIVFNVNFFYLADPGCKYFNIWVSNAALVLIVNLQQYLWHCQV